MNILDKLSLDTKQLPPEFFESLENLKTELKESQQATKDLLDNPSEELEEDMRETITLFRKLKKNFNQRTLLLQQYTNAPEKQTVNPEPEEKHKSWCFVM